MSRTSILSEPTHPRRGYRSAFHRSSHGVRERTRGQRARQRRATSRGQGKGHRILEDGRHLGTATSLESTLRHSQGQRAISQPCNQTAAERRQCIKFADMWCAPSMSSFGRAKRVRTSDARRRSLPARPATPSPQPLRTRTTHPGLPEARLKMERIERALEGGIATGGAAAMVCASVVGPSSP